LFKSKFCHDRQTQNEVPSQKELSCQLEGLLKEFKQRVIADESGGHVFQSKKFGKQ